MTHYINPIWFYLMNVSNDIKIFLCVSGIMSLICTVIALLLIDVEIMDSDNAKKKIFKVFKKIIIASIISLFIGTLIPSKETCIEMMIASQVTHENVTTTKEEIYEIVDYITDKVNTNKEGE